MGEGLSFPMSPHLRGSDQEQGQERGKTHQGHDQKSALGGGSLFFKQPSTEECRERLEEQGPGAGQAARRPAGRRAPVYLEKVRGLGGYADAKVRSGELCLKSRAQGCKRCPNTMELCP